MTLYSFEGVSPKLPADGDCWVAPNAQVMGQVTLGTASSIWFGAVLRGDNEPIVVGAGSNVQENATLHTDMGYPTTIGENCTIGHNAIVHGATVGDNSLIGMGATVLNGAKIGNNCLVGAGALVTEGKEIPDGWLIVGAPAVAKRPLSPEAIEGLRKSAAGYQEKMRQFRDSLKELD